MAILIFEEVEVLDFAGPFEVFSVASRVALRDGDSSIAPFSVHLCASSELPVRARGGLTVLPDYALSDAPQPDVLIVPGGVVTWVLEDTAVIEWISRSHLAAEVTASVCTGAFVLGRAGLLAGKASTTHWEDIADLRRQVPDTLVIENVPYVDEGRIVTSAGVSSGIEMNLRLVSRLTTPELARRTARQIEYVFNG